MRRFHLQLRVAVVLALSGAAGAGLAIGSGGGMLGVVLPAAMAVGAALWILALVGRLRGMTRTFVKSLKIKDSMLRFPPAADARIDALARDMNGIIAEYGSTLNSLETSRLYYDHITGTLTHEMRNGITPILSVSADMEAHPERYGPERSAEAIALIHEEAEAIHRFLYAYYELAHLPAPVIEDADASEYFAGIARAAGKMAAEKGLPESTVKFRVERGMMLRIDPTLLRRAVTNLIDNALYAVADAAEPTVEVTVGTLQGRPAITVADNGRGVAPEQVDNLFQPFCSTRPGGNGIGLCLSRRIARLHGGDLAYSPASPPPGARFTLHL